MQKHGANYITKGTLAGSKKAKTRRPNAMIFAPENACLLYTSDAADERK